MKKAFPIIIAAIVFVIALVLLRPAPSRMVVTASYDLRAGHVLQEEDLVLMSVPDDVLAVDVITDKAGYLIPSTLKDGEQVFTLPFVYRAKKWWITDKFRSEKQWEAFPSL